MSALSHGTAAETAQAQKDRPLRHSGASFDALERHSRVRGVPSEEDLRVREAAHAARAADETSFDLDYLVEVWPAEFGAAVILQPRWSICVFSTAGTPESIVQAAPILGFVVLRAGAIRSYGARHGD
eukprot:scaffold1203_cov74-Phaeocystis_antarctica.AAC.2